MRPLRKQVSKIGFRPSEDARETPLRLDAWEELQPGRVGDATVSHILDGVLYGAFSFHEAFVEHPLHICVDLGAPVLRHRDFPRHVWTRNSTIL